MTLMNKRGGLIVNIIIVVIIIAAGFALFSGAVLPNFGGDEVEEEIENDIQEIRLSEDGFGEIEEIARFAWLDVELKDVRTGDVFTIGQFEGTPILLESFAVWCPTCTEQQRQIRKLHDMVGEEVISISLDTDPNEDENRVLEHLDKNGFDWRYAISPIELTQGLIDDFGTGVVFAPAAPVILICPDLSARKLGSGVKKPAELLDEIGKCD